MHEMLVVVVVTVFITEQLAATEMPGLRKFQAVSSLGHCH